MSNINRPTEVGELDHDKLASVDPEDHHPLVTVSDPLTEDGNQGLGLSTGDGLGLSGGALAPALGNALAIDGNGNVYVPADAIDSAEIAADAVTNALIAAGAVDTAQLVANAVTGSEIAADAVGSGQIANDAVTTARIAADAITNALIAADAVDSAEIAANAVGTGHLSFDTATQGELDSHAGDTTNPHNVTDDQTGAATALSTHAANATVHHAQPSITADGYSATQYRVDSKFTGNGPFDIVNVSGSGVLLGGSYTANYQSEGSGEVSIEAGNISGDFPVFPVTPSNTSDGVGPTVFIPPVAFTGGLTVSILTSDGRVSGECTVIQ